MGSDQIPLYASLCIFVLYSPLSLGFSSYVTTSQTGPCGILMFKAHPHVIANTTCNKGQRQSQSSNVNLGIHLKHYPLPFPNRTWLRRVIQMVSSRDDLLRPLRQRDAQWTQIFWSRKATHFCRIVLPLTLICHIFIYFLLFLRFLGTIFELVQMLNFVGVGMSMVVPQDSWFRKWGRKTAACSLRFCFLRGSQDLEHWRTKTDWTSGCSYQICIDS